MWRFFGFPTFFFFFFPIALRCCHSFLLLRYHTTGTRRIEKKIKKSENIQRGYRVYAIRRRQRNNIRTIILFCRPRGCFAGLSLPRFNPFTKPKKNINNKNTTRFFVRSGKFYRLTKVPWGDVELLLQYEPCTRTMAKGDGFLSLSLSLSNTMLIDYNNYSILALESRAKDSDEIITTTAMTLYTRVRFLSDSGRKYSRTCCAGQQCTHVQSVAIDT